jgi:hypothetical protein
MLQILYEVFGKFYRKLNVSLSFFFLNRHSLKKYQKHIETFKDIQKIHDTEKLEVLNKKFIFNSFRKIKDDVISIIQNEKKLKTFLSNDIIHSFMFGLNRLFFFFELQELKKDKKWNKYWKKIIREDPIGNPIPYFLYPSSSGNRIHEVFNLKKLHDLDQENNLKKIKYVIEFGGGYGGFARIVKKVLKIKKYFIYDLKEINYLQYYYLTMLDEKVIFLKKKVNKNNNVYLFFDYKKLIRATSEINLDETLFVSNWAISETPIVLRKKFEHIIKSCKLNFFAFQEFYGNVNNHKYFERILNKNMKNTLFYNRNLERHTYMLSWRSRRLK